MKTYLTTTFLKHYKKRILPHKNLDKKFQQRRSLFLIDPTNPLLKDHQLAGDKKHYRAFSITGDIRVVYKKEDERTVRFYDIGTHNQVY